MRAMKVLLTGGTGFVGASVLQALLTAGHEVTAVVRSEESAKIVNDAGATPALGDASDSLWLAEQLNTVDAAIHAAAPDDDTAAAMDDAVIGAAIVGFARTEKPFIYTTGVWIYGAGEITEDSAFDPPELTTWRVERQERLLAGGIDAMIICPGIVYGYGKGIPGVISDAPRTEDGALTLVGSGEQHWVTIHVDDLADLYVAALERGTVGEVYFGASGVNPTVRELGEAVVGPSGSVVPEAIEATRARLGAKFADALLIDQQATGQKARIALGWEPSRPTLVEEFRSRA
jgi:nucleoside-diphosphate-sugar epimerase